MGPPKITQYICSVLQPAAYTLPVTGLCCTMPQRLMSSRSSRCFSASALAQAACAASSLRHKIDRRISLLANLAYGRAPSHVNAGVLQYDNGR